MQLIPELEPFREEIEVTLKPVMRIAPTPGKTEIWQSKFGGHPYLPIEIYHEELDFEKQTKDFPFPYPRNRETGELLDFLAQINFEEISHIEPFPKKGILQIFIDRGDPYLGMPQKDFFDQTAFRVIYYPEVIKDDSKLFKIQDFLGHQITENSLKFAISQEPVSWDDMNFDRYSQELQKTIHKNFAAYDHLLEGENNNLNKIGGYHQSAFDVDPRHNLEDGEDYILLIQLQSCKTFSWGDGGNASFFIKKMDLMNLDFTKILYHWDD